MADLGQFGQIAQRHRVDHPRHIAGIGPDDGLPRFHPFDMQKAILRAESGLQGACAFAARADDGNPGMKAGPEIAQMAQQRLQQLPLANRF